MLKRHSQLFLKLFILNDIFINSISFFLAYNIRFHSGFFPLVNQNIPAFKDYAPFFLFINVIWLIIFKEINLYEPKRGCSKLIEFFDLIKGVSIGVIILTGLLFFYRGETYSRLTLIIFWVLNISMLETSRTLVRSYLCSLRRRGKNLRHMIIAGAGTMGRDVSDKLRKMPELGYNIVGFLDDSEKTGSQINGITVLGATSSLAEIAEKENIDEVIITLPMRAHENILKLINICHKEGLRVRIVPDLFEVMTHKAQIDELDGIPLIGLEQSALESMGNRFLKRLEDIIISSLALIILSPLYILIAILVKLTSKGPVFFKQERVGLDNRSFYMYKFRSMKIDAEVASGPVWAQKDDPRRTKFGTFLRSTSLDELPQFFNVLKGEMSLVGPRPERPHFVKQFKEEVTHYMQRHYVKTGITGWAQINGWRGNTSIEKRIECDIYYIENWSLGLDLKILWYTIWKGFINESAY